MFKDTSYKSKEGAPKEYCTHLLHIREGFSIKTFWHNDSPHDLFNQRFIHLWLGALLMDVSYGMIHKNIKKLCKDISKIRKKYSRRILYKQHFWFLYKIYDTLQAIIILCIGSYKALVYV